MRIVAHNGAPEFGGAEKATAILLEGLGERGHEVTLSCNRDVVARGVAEYDVDVRRDRLGGDIAVHDAVRFGYRLRREGADVLIVTTFRKLWLAGLAGRLAGVPVVVRIGLSTDVPRNLKYEWVLRNWVNVVVTNARGIADAYRDALPHAPPPHITTVHQGIHLPDAILDPAKMRRALSIPEDAPLIGGVGRLVRQKRFDRLLHTLALLPPETHCLVIGHGPLRGALESLADDLGVASRVRFTGHRTDVLDLMGSLDLLVITSDREGLANVMIEALSVGTPIVTTPVSGAEDALETSASGEPPGRIVRPEPSRLAETILSLLADPVGLERMGRSARAIAERRFGRERMLDAWESVLRFSIRDTDRLKHR